MIQFIPEKIRCRYCADSGAVFASHKNIPEAGPYIFLCWCDMGKRRGSAYPKWQNAPQESFDLAPAYSIADMAEMNPKKIIRTHAGIVADVLAAKEDA